MANRKHHRLQNSNGQRSGSGGSGAPSRRSISAGADLHFRFRRPGDAGPESDYDLMVIVPDGAPPERLRADWPIRHWGTGTAADVVVWIKSAFERRTRVVSSLPATVSREGMLLYGG